MIQLNLENKLTTEFTRGTLDRSFLLRLSSAGEGTLWREGTGNKISTTGYSDRHYKYYFDVLIYTTDE